MSSSQPYPWGGSPEQKVSMEGYRNPHTNYYGWGIHNNKVILGNLAIWFHYRIPIAFQKGDEKTVICANERGCSGIGRALNTISRDKSIRICYDDFLFQLHEVLAKPCF